MQLEIVGGPFDGGLAAPSRPRAFYYVDQVGDRFFCRAQPGKGTLYRTGLAHRSNGVQRVLKHAPNYTECSGCHAFHISHVARCTLCGTDLAQGVEHQRGQETHRQRTRRS